MRLHIGKPRTIPLGKSEVEKRYEKERAEKLANPNRRLHSCYFKHPRLSKSGKSVVRGFTREGRAQIEKYHKKQMEETKMLREKYLAHQKRLKQLKEAKQNA